MVARVLRKEKQLRTHLGKLVLHLRRRVNYLIAIIVDELLLSLLVSNNQNSLQARIEQR